MKGQVPSLGRLELVDPRLVWPHEALSFTPWLAQTENLLSLGEAIGLELELEAVEQAVGPFRADLLCRQTGSDHWVLIENQLEKTDHAHLGQVLTYAAGLEAVTVVWISPSFTEEHRACLDWLNRSTIKGLNFFGVQLEVWRIGDSQMAPKFHIVSMPNDWAESVSQASSALSKPETVQIYLDYWSNYRDHIVSNRMKIRPSKPQPQSWISIAPFGNSDFEIVAATNRQQTRVRVELYIKGIRAHAWFSALQQNQAEIECALGSLFWNQTAQKGRTIVQHLENADPANKNDWNRQHQWLADRVVAFQETFGPLISKLRPDIEG